MAKKIFKNLCVDDTVFEVVKPTYNSIIKHTVTEVCHYYNGGGDLKMDNGVVLRVYSLNQNRIQGRYFLSEEDALSFIEWRKFAKTFGNLCIGDKLYCIKEDNTIEEVIIGNIVDKPRYSNSSELYRYFYADENFEIFHTLYGLDYDKILKEHDETQSSWTWEHNYLRIFINKKDAEKDVAARAKRKIKTAIEKKMKIKPYGTLLTKKDRFGKDLHVGDKVHYIYSYMSLDFRKTTLYTINEGVVVDETKETISVKCTAPSDMDDMMNKTTPDRIVILKKWNE